MFREWLGVRLLPDLSRWPGLLRFGTRQFCILDLVLHALRLNSGNSGVTLPGPFGLDLCSQTGNLPSLRCNERPVVGHAIIFRLLLDPLFMTFQAC